MIYAVTSSLNQGILLFCSEIALRIHLIAFAREGSKFIGTLLKTSETTRSHASAFALFSSSSFLLSPSSPSSALKASLSCFIPWVARTIFILSLLLGFLPPAVSVERTRKCTWWFGDVRLRNWDGLMVLRLIRNF